MMMMMMMMIVEEVVVVVVAVIVCYLYTHAEVLHSIRRGIYFSSSLYLYIVYHLVKCELSRNVLQHAQRKANIREKLLYT